jgi:hypothetical protein
LVVRAVPGARVRVLRLNVANAGWRWEPLAPDVPDAPEELRIR